MRRGDQYGIFEARRQCSPFEFCCNGSDYLTTEDQRRVEAIQRQSFLARTGEQNGIVSPPKRHSAGRRDGLPETSPYEPCLGDGYLAHGIRPDAMSRRLHDRRSFDRPRGKPHRETHLGVEPLERMNVRAQDPLVGCEPRGFTLRLMQ